MTFIQAVAFQWVNPKAWSMVLGAAATYVPPDRPFVGTIIIAVLFDVVGPPCGLTWASCGVALKQFLNRPGHLRAFNVTMALLLVASLYPMLSTMLPHSGP